jgi:hypothetical protein
MPDQALDFIVIALIDILKSRAAFGIGTGLALKPLDWIQKAQEELMDGIIY